LGYLLYKLQLAKEKADYSKLSMNIKVVMLSGIMYAMVFGYTLLSNL
jgi:hypothetical protein